MKEKIFAIFGVVLGILVCSSVVYAEIKTQELEYSSDGITLKGYLAYDDQIEGKRPGILVVHEWWGHNDYARRRARMLAELGYTALAVDMYGDAKRAKHPDDAGQFASQVMKNMETVGLARFIAALDQLKSQPTVDPEKVAAIGYCFGGSVVLHMARFGIDLDGVVSFHGNFATSTPAQAGKVKARILVCHGDDDQFISQEVIDSFKREMAEAQVDYRFVSYRGARHSFTNPDADQIAQKFGLNIAYNQQADQKSWQDMQDFFSSIFQEK